ncbi:MAG TPA: hypothetical protein VHB73_07950 [Alphaproteobacteria bacterium]|nr:hypothetical protein [Alphaproteobacteria bacterium]
MSDVDFLRVRVGGLAKVFYASILPGADFRNLDADRQRLSFALEQYHADEIRDLMVGYETAGENEIRRRRHLINAHQGERQLYKLIKDSRLEQCSLEARTEIMHMLLKEMPAVGAEPADFGINNEGILAAHGRRKPFYHKPGGVGIRRLSPAPA